MQTQLSMQGLCLPTQTTLPLANDLPVIKPPKGPLAEVYIALAKGDLITVANALYAIGLHETLTKPHQKRAYGFVDRRKDQSTTRKDFSQVDMATRRLSNGTLNQAMTLLTQYAKGFGLAVMPGKCHGNPDYDGAALGYLAIIDCDDLQAGDVARRELTERKIMFWEERSANGVHFWVWTDKRPKTLYKANAKRPHGYSFIPNSEIKANGLVVVAPSESSKTDAQGCPIKYRFVHIEPIRVTPFEQLAEIGFQLERERSIQLQKAARIANNADAKKTIALADQIESDGVALGSRNSALFFLACTRVGMRWDESRVMESVQKAAQKCSPPYPSHPNEPSVETIVSYALRRVQASAKSHTSHQTDLGEFLLRIADSYEWQKGRAGRSARLVFEALIAIWKRAGYPAKFHASLRQIGQMCGAQIRSLEGINKPLKRLIAAGLVRRMGQRSKMSATEYALDIEGCVAQADKWLTSQELLDCCLSTCATTAENDVWGEFGGASREIWRALSGKLAANGSQIAKLAHVHRSTVSRNIQKLLEAGLVIKTPDGYTAESHPDWAAIASGLSVAGTSEALIAKRREKAQANFDRMYLDMVETLLRWETLRKGEVYTDRDGAIHYPPDKYAKKGNLDVPDSLQPGTDNDFVVDAATGEISSRADDGDEAMKQRLPKDIFVAPVPSGGYGDPLGLSVLFGRLYKPEFWIRGTV